MAAPTLESRPAAATAPAGGAPDGLVDVTAGGRPRRGPWSRVPRRVRRLTGPVVLLLAWAVASELGLLNRDLFPPPLAVAARTWELVVSGELQTHVGASLARVVVGTVIGVLVGGALAVVAGLTRTGEDLLDSTMQILKAVPNFALLPLLIIWMGIGEEPKIVLIVLGVGIAIYINTYGGIRNVDAQLVEVAQTLGVSRWQLVTQVVLPGAAPGFLVGLRLGLSSAWLSLIFAETINTTQGIGYLMSRAQTMLQFDVSVLIILIYAVAGLLSYALVRHLEHRLLAWRAGFTGVAA
ncbi:ABC transporter permease [Isoptericola sp. NPDC056605]|uniref:ABC transporter permease n=1 Tax=Isoptericola sp. NPDC056605 TaxID=3345876 RepID=UPI0036762052